MLISKILAWVTVLFGVFEILRFFARISKIKKLNRFFHKIHIPFGVLMLITGGMHGVLAGNFADASFADFEFAPMLFTFNFGTLCYLIVILLGVTYLLRKLIKKLWMPLHRILTVSFIVILVIHLIDMGIIFANIGTDRDISATETTESTFVTDPTALVTESVSEPASSEIMTEAVSEIALKFSGAVIKDGTYSGSARGRNGLISVSVTVSGGQVSDILITDHIETPKYFDRAISVTDRIISSQSLGVDAVSGATISSEGIKEAVYNALSDAVISGELTIN